MDALTTSADPESALTAARCERLLRQWRGRDRDAPWRTLPELFADQVARSPHAPAIAGEGVALSYRQTSDAVERLAARLAAAGAGSERLVGVCLPRSAGLVLTLLAVVRTGAAYLPLDPDLPRHRIEVMIADAQPVCVVTEAGLGTFAPGGAAWCLQGAGPATDDGSDASVDVYTRDCQPEPAQLSLPHPLNPAYSIYTSGSSGTPKGVLVSHSAIVNRLLWMQRYFEIGPDDRILQKTPFHFDVSVWEFFWPLITGATLVVARAGGHLDPRYLAEAVERWRVTTIHFVPSMLALFLDEPIARHCTSLRRVVCSGEALSPQLQDRFTAALDVPLHNLYGPTEAAVDVTAWECVRTQPDTVPIGHEIDNIRIYVLDRHLTPVPEGETGELFLAGAGLARGYLNRPALTADRFLPDPFGPPSARMYRTGDLARRRADGALEYLGRSDDQVKIHGVRIELAEVEAALAGFPGIAAAAVTVHEEQLTGFVVAAPEGDSDRTAHWREIFTERYSERPADADFDMRGWVSSIQTEDLSLQDMRQWRDRTVAALRELRPARVLEIGCGSGLLATELIGYCAEYVGMDVAEDELHALQRRLDELAPGRARLLPLEANQTSQVPGEFDLIIVNSVVQYFPDSAYLADTLTQAVAKCAPGGALFVGDVRHRGLARLLYAERAVARTGAERAELDRLIEASGYAEQELLVHPGFFAGLAGRLGIRADQVEVRPKPGDYDNELSRFRYDVVIRLGADREPQQAQVAEAPDYDWCGLRLDTEALARLLHAGPPALTVRGIRNARLRRALALLNPAAVHDEGVNGTWLYPGELIGLAAAHGYQVRLDWAGGTPDGSFDAALYREGPPPRIARPVSHTFDPADFTNRPSAARSTLPPAHGIWTYLRENLPAALVPARIVTIGRLPLTASGKLDRKALLALVPERTGAGGPAPRTAAEKVLCELFEQALGAHPVGIDDGFFELGGDSIMAIQTVGRARAAGLALTLGDVFRHRTPRALAVVATPAGPAVTPRTDADLGPLPLTPIAHWCAERGEPIAGYCQWVLLRTPPDLTCEDLSLLLRAVIDGHDALRTTLTVRGPQAPEPSWHLEIPPRGAVDAAALITRVAGPHAAGPLTAGQLAAHAAAAADRLRPDQGVNVQAVWLDAGADRPGRLLLAIHHLVVDGISWRILAQDLGEAWHRLRAGAPVVPPGYATAYREWALRLPAAAESRQAELPGWLSVLRTPDPPLGDGRLDPAIDLISTVETAEFELEPTVTEALLTRVPARFGVEINDVLLAALAAALGAALGGERDARHPVLLNLEGHGREDVLDGIDLSRTVGWFTSTFPVAIGPVPRFAGGDRAAWAERALRGVWRQRQALPDRGIGYGMLRYLDPVAGPELARHPAPQISFNYLGRFPAGGGEDWGLAGECRAVRSLSPQGLAAAHTLEIQAMVEDSPDGSRLSADLAWAGRLLTADRARTIGAAWFEALREFARAVDDDVTGSGSGPGAGADARPGPRPSDFPLVSLSEQDLALLVAEVDGAAAAESRLGASLIENVLPLSPMQSGLLFHAEYDDEGPDVYLVQAVIDLEGVHDSAALRTACAALLERHDALRASFHFRGLSNPVQMIRHGEPLPWTELDVSALDHARQEAGTRAFLEYDRSRRFDLTRPPLRFAALDLGPGRRRLVFSHHHLLLDGWSIQILVDDLVALCSGRAAPPPPPYREYQMWLAGRGVETGRRAWARQLDDLPEPVPLVPAGYRAQPGAMPDSVGIDLSPETTRAVAEQARARSLTLHSVVAALWGITLGGLTGRRDVVVGTVMSGRPAEIPGVERMTGLFANTVPLRVAWSPRESACLLAARVQDGQAAMVEHQHVGLGEIQRAVGRRHLFDTFIEVENYPAQSAGWQSQDDRGTRVSGLRIVDAAHYPLGVLVAPGPPLRIRLEFQERALDRQSVERIARSLRALFDAFAAQPDIAIGALPAVPTM